MKEILDKLKAPMEYKSRPGKGGSGSLAYINARQAMDRLDEVCGANWACDYKEVKGNVYCTISLLIEGNWIGRTDCGTESNFDAEKGESSDAFKRAAVKWGVGRFLYNIKSVTDKKIYAPAQPSEKLIGDPYGEPIHSPVIPTPTKTITGVADTATPALDSYGRPEKVEGGTCADCNTAKIIKSPKTNKLFCEDKCWTK